jgi:hypothetical protein
MITRPQLTGGGLLHRSTKKIFLRFAQDYRVGFANLKGTKMLTIHNQDQCHRTETNAIGHPLQAQGGAKIGHV